MIAGLAVVKNSGLLEATGSAGLLINGEIDGSGGGIIEANNGSQVVLSGVTIIGGTLKTVGTGEINVLGFSELDGSNGHAVQNLGAFSISNGNEIIFAGVIDNIGTIKLNAAADFSAVLGENATLEGRGQIILSDSSNNFLELQNCTNVDNTISGAGQIDWLTNGQLGVVNATGTTNQLVLNYSIFNSGLLEATGSAGLAITGSVDNTSTGVIQANASSQVDLEGIIEGGTLKTVGSGVIAVDDGTRNSTGCDPRQRQRHA